MFLILIWLGFLISVYDFIVFVFVLTGLDSDLTQLAKICHLLFKKSCFAIARRRYLLALIAFIVITLNYNFCMPFGKIWLNIRYLI